MPHTEKTKRKPKRTNLLNLIEYASFRALLWKLGLFPYKLSRKVIVGLFIGIGYGLGIRKKTAEHQLRMVYPDWSEQKIKQVLRDVYRNLGLTTAEIYLQKENQFLESISFSGMNHIDKARELGRGVILATAHLGNWEAARVFPYFGIPLSVVVKKQHNPYFDTFNNQIRMKHGVSLINFRRGLRDILKHLNQNEVVAILSDQNAGEAGLVSDFLGFPASHWKGVAKLSLRYQVPIVPGFSVRTPEGGIKFSFEPMIFHPELDDKDENYPYVLTKINAVIEKYVNRYPEQWLWLHKRWKATGAMRTELPDF